ncbi:HlyD family type I secretion periplasmic adaptor subunit [Vibrio sp. ZSDZ65]|uniref:Membrane fusion protein (MFP) family protein n=1 Tax=Vibrio qingdaonensis TaxID=2829491 RepID=A0A9X3CK91_9VIBR|nr:HlyD family type I secretion periplasmic adaptor subunit [Vibrio qingdaonensis]MCW8344724.1 HlyD family type I secretion periplasmic adaptor subunit [Vibrio qingdaonensis]
MKLTHTETSRSFNLSLSGHVLFGWLVLLLCVVGVGYWSYQAPLSSASLAPGKLVTELENQAVQHHTGGVVETLSVKEGQRVEKGDLLLVLSDPLLVSQLEQLNQKQFIVQSRLSRVEAELSGTTIQWTEVNDLTPIQVQIRRDQVSLLNQNRLIHKEQLASLHQQITQSENDSDSYKAWLSSDAQSLKLLSEEIEANSALLKKGYVSKVAFLELKREYSSLVARIAEHRTRINRAQSKIIELGSQIDAMKMDFMRTAQEKKQTLVSEQQAILKQLKASNTLNDRIEVRAPVSGEVINLTIHTQGGVIAPTSTILEIVPKNTRVVASVNIQPKDIESVYEGLSANIRLTSYSFRQVPAVTGELIHLSADSIVDERLGGHFYQGKIALDATELLDLGLDLKPGMPVEAQIVLEERTVLDYLLSPLIQSMEKGMREI